MLYLLALLVSAIRADIVPLTLWSGQSYFQDDHTEVDSTVTLNEVLDTLRMDAQAHNSLTGYLRSTEKPEVLVAFVADTLNTAEAARQAGGYSSKHAATGLKDLKLQLTTAASTLQIPYVNTGSIPSLSGALRGSVSPSAQALHADLGKGDATGRCAKLVGELQGKAGLFDNGVTDLVLVSYPASLQAESGDCLNTVMSYIRRTTPQYLALYSAESAPQLRTDFHSLSAAAATPLSADSLPGGRRNLLQNTGNTTLNCELYGYCGPKYVTPTGMFAILLLLFMILTFWCGLSAMLEVQAPPRFAYQSLRNSLAKEM